MLRGATPCVNEPRGGGAKGLPPCHESASDVVKSEPYGIYGQFNPGEQGNDPLLTVTDPNPAL